MFTINALQLIIIILASALGGAIIGFVTMAALSVSGRCSRDEERREWPGEVEVKQ